MVLDLWYHDVFYSICKQGDWVMAKQKRKVQKITGFVIDPISQRVTRVSIGDMEDALHHSLRLSAGEMARSRQFLDAPNDTVDGIIVWDKEPSHPCEQEHQDHMAVLTLNNRKVVLYSRALVVGFTLGGSCESVPLTLDETKQRVSFVERQYLLTNPDGAIHTMKPNMWNAFLNN